MWVALHSQVAPGATLPQHAHVASWHRSVHPACCPGHMRCSRPVWACAQYMRLVASAVHMCLIRAHLHGLYLLLSYIENSATLGSPIPLLKPRAHAPNSFIIEGTSAHECLIRGDLLCHLILLQQMRLWCVGCEGDGVFTGLIGPHDQRLRQLTATEEST